jgi:formylglycine-generating enzyme required for sulfatase activity
MQNRRWVMGLCGLLAVAAWSCRAEEKPKTVDDTIPNTTVKFTMVQVPAGKITIKDKDGKDAEFAIKPIWIGKTEVTWDEYDNFWQCLDLPKDERGPAVKSKSRPSAPYEPPDRGWGHEGSPAGSMFCREAKRYCEWLSKKTGKKYRLPTEAEWEYACRAGGPPVKLEKGPLKEVAWFADNSDDMTHPVAQKKPNAWGLYDTLGNVAEWVIRADGTEAVAGGSFQDEAEDVNSAARAVYSPAWQRKDPQDPKGQSWFSNGGHVGFRIVRED